MKQEGREFGEGAGGPQSSARGGAPVSRRGGGGGGGRLRRGQFCICTFHKGCKASDALPRPVEPLPRDSELKTGCTLFIFFRFIKSGALVPLEDRPENPDCTCRKVPFQF